MYGARAVAHSHKKGKNMATTIDEITIDYSEESGQQIIKQLDKVVLSKGAWTTIMFLFAEWDRKNQKWSAPKARIDRFQKKNGVYRSQSKFKFTSVKQAEQIIEVFQNWIQSGQFIETPQDEQNPDDEN